MAGGNVDGASSWVMVNTGQMSSHAMHAMSQTSPTAIVSKALTKPAGCGHTATQAPHLIQAFHPMANVTGGCFIKDKACTDLPPGGRDVAGGESESVG